MNRAIITNDFEKLLNRTEYNELIQADELKVEHIAQIRHIAYIAEKEKKTILIMAKKYNVYAQNAFLKLLEETPDNVEFIVVTDSKYKLLDTVLSRLQTEKIFFEPEKKQISISKISNDFIFDMLKKDMEKDDIKTFLKELLSKETDEEKLKLINDAILMLELNIDKKAVLAAVLLSFKEKR